MIPVNPDAVKHQVQFRIEALRARTCDDLVQLPEWTTELVSFGETECELITYRIGAPGDDIKIVVQALPPGSRRGVLWIGVQAAGLRIAPDGATMRMTERELYDYM